MADQAAASVRYPSQRLALLLQETLTAVARIRGGRESVPSMDAFRGQVQNALRLAEEEARRAGYTGADVRIAVYAVVALLDESVMASSNPVFRDWPRRPLQQEWFAGHVAGETFFEQVRSLLTADDSHRTADLLEVHLLCLLLGYRGRFGSDRDSDLRAIEDRIIEKIRRIRGYDPLLSPNGLPPKEQVIRTGDPLGRNLIYATIAIAVLAVVLFAVYKLSLSSSISGLQASTGFVQMEERA